MGAASTYTGLIAPDDPNFPAPQRAMMDATPDCIKILSVDGHVLMMNRAGCLALNVSQDSQFGMPWLPLLSESVRLVGEEALRRAVTGVTASFFGESSSLAGTIFWDNLLIPIMDDAQDGKVLSILCVSRDVTEKKLAEQKLEDAINREKLLAREMQHRIKNIFSVISGLILFAEREANLTDTTESATTLLRKKIDALARASDAVFTHEHPDSADTDIETVAKSVLKPYGEQCVLIGPPTPISRDGMTPMALFLHELATNSVKYGSLGTSGGSVTFCWKANGKMLDLKWTEAGGPPVSAIPKQFGFGSEMIDRLLRSMDGIIDRQWREDGLVVDLQIPNLLHK